MEKIQLTEQESKVYNLIIERGIMEDMFEFGYAIGRARLAQEQLDNLNLEQLRRDGKLVHVLADSPGYMWFEKVD